MKTDYTDIKFQDNGKLKLLIIVGSESRVYQMVDNNRKTLRYTGLRYFLQEEVGSRKPAADDDSEQTTLGKTNDCIN